MASRLSNSLRIEPLYSRKSFQNAGPYYRLASRTIGDLSRHAVILVECNAITCALVELHEDFDDGLQRLAGLAPPREASTAELDASARDLRRAEKEAGNSEFQGLLGSLNGKETATEHLQLLTESSRLYRAYEDIVAKIARDRQGEKAERGLLVYLRRARISALGQCPG